MNATARSPLVQAASYTYCIRTPNLERRKGDEAEKYKKGYEVRFSVADKAEEKELRAILGRLGLKGGRAYAKVNRLIVPVYGKEAVRLFGT